MRCYCLVYLEKACFIVGNTTSVNRIHTIVEHGIYTAVVNLNVVTFVLGTCISFLNATYSSTNGC